MRAQEFLSSAGVIDRLHSVIFDHQSVLLICQRIVGRACHIIAERQSVRRINDALGRFYSTIDKRVNGIGNAPSNN